MAVDGVNVSLNTRAMIAEALPNVGLHPQVESGPRIASMALRSQAVTDVIPYLASDTAPKADASVVDNRASTAPLQFGKTA